MPGDYLPFGLRDKTTGQWKGLFSAPILEDGKTPVTRCENTGKFSALADIDKSGVRVITPPGGTTRFYMERMGRRVLAHTEKDWILECGAWPMAELLVRRKQNVTNVLGRIGVLSVDGLGLG
jgi:hypothetical protein